MKEKRKPTGRGWPEDGASFNRIADEWHQDLGDLVYPRGPCVDLASLACSLEHTLAEIPYNLDIHPNSDLPWLAGYWNAHADPEAPDAALMHLMSKVTGLSMGNIAHAGSVGAAQQAHEKAQRVLNWASAAKSLAPSEACMEIGVHMESPSRDWADREWHMIRRFPNPGKAIEWLKAVKRRAHKIAPYGIGVWHSPLAFDAGQITLRCAPRHPRKAAVVYVAVLFDLVRRTSMVTSHESMNRIRNMSYAHARKCSLPHSWADWRDPESETMRSCRRIERASRKFGRRFSIWDLHLLHRFLSCDIPAQEATSAARGLRRRGISRPLIKVLLCFERVREPAAKRLVERMAKGERESERVFDALPAIPLTEEASQRLSKEKDILSAIAEVAFWSGMKMRKKAS